MTSTVLAFAAVAAVLSYGLSVCYRRAWMRRPSDTTPTGFGAFLPVYMLAGAMLAAAPPSILIAFLIVAGAAAVYWLDDLGGLAVRLRFAIQFGVGAAISWLVLQPVYGGSAATIVGLALAGGLVNIVLTNVVNFYDGADLNLATFVLLSAVCVLVFGRSDLVLVLTAVMVVAFVIPFALVNRKARTLYLGDSGSFAFACLMTVAATRYIAADGGISPLIAAPLALPMVDVAFVFLLRLAKREDLLSRNYHHLYQRLQIERDGFGYLIPQIACAVIVIGASMALEFSGMHRFWAAVTAMGAAVPVIYLASRRLFLRRPWLG